MQRRFEVPFPILKLIAWGIMRPCFRFEVRGLEHIQNVSGRVILVGNHTGYLDSFAVVAAFNRTFRFIMTEEVFTWGLIGKLVRFGNIVPLYKNKEKRVLVDVIRELRQEQAICIFPEGKLTQDGALLPFNEGAVFLQEKSGAPIIPFAIQGGFEAWPQTRRWPVFRKVILVFGQPIAAGHGLSRAELTTLLQVRVAELQATSTQAHPSELSSIPFARPTGQRAVR